MDMNKKIKGFTLVEMMITVAILAVLVGLAGPYFGELIRNNRVQTQAQVIFSALISARSEAIKRNHSVTLCKSADGSSCTTSGDWDQGWIIFADEDNDGALDTGEDILRVQELISSGITLRATGTFASVVRFRSDGTISGAQDSLWICDADEDIDARKVTISNTGRPRTEKTSDNCPSSS